MRLFSWTVLFVVGSLLPAALPAPQPPAPSAAPVEGLRGAAPIVQGLDHIPIAVADLERAAGQYRKLGFALKPGRPHENGIRNQHVKFKDGTELELITAPEARDTLTRHYREHLAKGDGPAFLALFAPDREALARRLSALGTPSVRSGGLIGMPDASPLGYLFFGGRNASPTDRPEHFQHANGAESLVAVWLAGDDLKPEKELLTALGATWSRREVRVPEAMQAEIARFPEGEVLLLAGSHQLVLGRRIVGATLRTRDLGMAERCLKAAGLPVPQVVRVGKSASLFLPPKETYGLWLELRQAD